MQREERIYERRAAAQDGRRLRLEYCRLETPDENTTSFGAAIRCVSDAAGGRSRNAGLSARDRRGLAVRDFFGAKSEFFPVCTGHADAFLI